MVPSNYLCKCQQRCGGRHTLEAVFEAVLWSLRFAALGRHPPSRHDQSPFTDEDSQRLALSNQPLPWKFLLLWIKGDWEGCANYYGLPSWGANRICWLCAATKDTFATMSHDDVERMALASDDFFAWARQESKATALIYRGMLRTSCVSLNGYSRLGMWFSVRLRVHAALQPPKVPCSLFSCPGVGTWSVAIDWMHVVDLGVGQDILGGVLFSLFQTLPGRPPSNDNCDMHGCNHRHPCFAPNNSASDPNVVPLMTMLGANRGNKVERLGLLWQLIHDYYSAEQPHSRLGSVVMGMLKRPTQWLQHVHRLALECKLCMALECKLCVPGTLCSQNHPPTKAPVQGCRVPRPRQLRGPASRPHARNPRGPAVVHAPVCRGCLAGFVRHGPRVPVASGPGLPACRPAAHRLGRACRAGRRRVPGQTKVSPAEAPRGRHRSFARPPRPLLVLPG